MGIFKLFENVKILFIIIGVSFLTDFLINIVIRFLWQPYSYFTLIHIQHIISAFIAFIIYLIFLSCQTLRLSHSKTVSICINSSFWLVVLYIFILTSYPNGIVWNQLRSYDLRFENFQNEVYVKSKIKQGMPCTEVDSYLSSETSGIRPKFLCNKFPAQVEYCSSNNTFRVIYDEEGKVSKIIRTKLGGCCPD